MAGTPNGPGSVLAGRFILEDLLDEDGEARFWRATDRTLARSVAVHVLPDSDPRAAPLLAAARSSALVSDPRLLRVLDAASTDGVVYVVNEWGSGVSLDRLLSEGPLSPRRAAWVVREVADSIATAHRNGVAHGRLLPENVMVSESGSVKVIGFVIDAVLRPGSSNGSWPRPVTGGDPLSPHESDVLNLAGLLYVALVGRWPGTEGSTMAPAPSEHGRPLRPRQVRAGVPRPLDAICERVLGSGSHHQQEPIETAHEISAALSDYMGDRIGGPSGSTAVGHPVRSSDGAGAWPFSVGNEAARTTGTDTDTGTGTGSDLDTGDLPVTGMQRAPDAHRRAAPSGSADDPEATQAVPVPDFAGSGAPVAGDGERDVPSGSEGPPGRQAARAASRPPRTPASDRPARPLFAEGPPAATAHRPLSAAGDSGSFAGEQRSIGAGNGRLPTGWGPDAEPASADPDGDWDTGGHDRSVPGRSWLRLAVVLGVLVALVVAVVLAFYIGRGGSGAEPTPAEQSTVASSQAAQRAGVPIAIAAVRDFDPQGDPPEENPDLADLAVDGKPGTAWRTSTYYDPLEEQKSGVGLLVDLGRPKKVSDVRLTLLGSPTEDRPTDLEILAAPRDATAPTSTDGLTKAAKAEGAGTQVNLPLTKDVTTRWLVVWFTRLPTVPGGYQARVAEISVRS